MTRRTILAMSSFALGGGLLKAQNNFRLTPNAESELTLEVTKTGLMSGKKHHLVFSRYEGMVTQQPKPQVAFTVQANSLECQDDWVKPKDREKITRYGIDELLEASKYPELKYRSTSVAQNGDGYTIEGDLTIKRETHPVTVKVARNPDKSGLWKGEATIRFKDFNLKPPTAALGTIGTEDAMRLLFHVKSETAA